VWIFLLGMLTFAVGYLVFNITVGIRRPTQAGIVEDYSSICFWYDERGSMQASISPQGCYSPTCTHQVSQTGSAVIDQDKFQIHLESRFVLAKTSRFLLPCIENCFGGGTVNFDLGELQVGKYEVWFRDEMAGELNVFSGLPTPRQCLENPTG
jgi:hypothetical protein